MSTLNLQQLRPLFESQPGLCASIFLPTFRAGAETQQNPIRLKNLLRETQEQLLEQGLPPEELDGFLEPVRALLHDEPFWRHPQDGLALFRSSDLFQTYEVSRSLPELAIVERRFYLKPLFPLLQGDGRFYVLGISQNRIRLFEGDRDHLHEMELGPEVPKSLTDALGDQLTKGTLQFDVSTPGAQGRTGAPNFHGQGGGEEDSKTELLNYFNLVDHGLKKLPLDRQAPLVLAGVEYLFPLFREASEHPHLLATGIPGNPDRASAEELHGKAWEIVGPVFLEAEHKAGERFGDLLGNGRSSSQVDEVLPAAHDGRVETLWVAQGVRLWGHYDAGSRSVETLDERRNGSEDLLDLAAVQTYLNGGAVFSVEPAQMPSEGKPLAAIFRY
jgi:Bacterial archaeo-eukaryotic release factor family 3